VIATQAIAEPVAHEVVVTAHDVTVEAGAFGQNPQRFVAQFGRDLFVAVHGDDPGMGGLGDGPVVLGDVIFIGMFENARAVAAGDFDGTVGTVGVHDEDFIGPADGFQTGTDEVLDILRQHQGRYFLPVFHTRTRLVRLVHSCQLRSKVALEFSGFPATVPHFTQAFPKRQVPIRPLEFRDSFVAR